MLTVKCCVPRRDMPLDKDTTEVSFEGGGMDGLGVCFSPLAAPDHECSGRGGCCRGLPLIDTVHPRGSAHEGKLSDHPFLQAGRTNMILNLHTDTYTVAMYSGVSVVTAVRLNVMGRRGRPTVKCQDVPDFETFRDLLDKRTAQLRAGGGDLFKGLIVHSYIFDADSTAKERPPVGIPEKQSEVLPTRPTRGHGLSESGITQGKLESAPLPASERAAT
eukprot:SAG31_NODE_6688_length_1924_cov_3.074521_2_plen_217_part_01